MRSVTLWSRSTPSFLGRNSARCWSGSGASRAVHKSRAGRKPMDAVVMFKTLVLGALYNLSDDQIEYQVPDNT